MTTGIDLLSGVLASAALQWVVNGLPIEATYLTAPHVGCAVASARAKHWRESEKIVAEQRVGEWCVVGTVIDGYWVSEQWRAASLSIGSAVGWRIRSPLPGQRVSGPAKKTDWPIDVVDPSISTRVQFRWSLDPIDLHHEKTLIALAGSKVFRRNPSIVSRSNRPLLLSRLQSGELVVSGASNNARYSVVIQQVEKR